MGADRRYGFTCQSCRRSIDTPFDADHSDDAHRYAQEQGWRYVEGPGGGFDGGWGANVTCDKCVAGYMDRDVAPIWVGIDG